ncbi:MAG: ABC transporter permease [Ignavibacteria bacterium]
MKNFNKYLINILGPITAIIASLIAGAVFILAIGKNPIEVYNILIAQTLGNSYGIGQVLFKTTPLIFTGLAVAFAFKAGLFNIGAEGQLNIGAFATAWVGFTLTALPSYLLIPLCLISGVLGGGLWGGIAGYLKAKFGSHEVINTIMLNFIAAALVSYLVNEVYNVPATIHSPEISTAAQITRLDSMTDLFKGSPFNLSFLIAILCCGIMYYVIWRTPFGYDIRTLGSNRSAAEYAKMNIGKLVTYSMTISGAFAGLVGCNFVLGYEHYFELGFSEGAGYIGIAVALIARNNPWAVILTAFFFGILEYGGLTINTIVPKELVAILQAILIFFTIIIAKIFERIKLKPKVAFNA